MSPTLEDRLAAALRARAEEVTTADLRPLEQPAPSRRLGRGRTVSLGIALVAAATLAALAVPALRDGGSPGRVDPAPPVGTPSPDEVGRATGDVDGDGRDDLVLLDRAGTVRVEPGDGADPVERRFRRSALLGLADIGAGGLAVVLSQPYDDGVAGRKATRTRVLRWQGDALVEVGTLDDAWLGGDNAQTVWVGDRRLLTGTMDPQDSDQAKIQVFGMRWVLDGDLLAGTPVGELCWQPSQQDHPAPCHGAGFGLDVGSPDGLPALFPEVTTTYEVGDSWTFPGSTDEAHFTGPKDTEVAAGEVTLAVTVDGVEGRAAVPAGGSPALLGRTARSRGDSPVFLVTQETGDAMRMTYFMFWNGTFQALPAPANGLLGNGYAEVGGTLRHHRTWLSAEGWLYTAVELDPQTGRSRLLRWSDDPSPASVTAEELGEVCLDWSTDPVRYGGC